MNVKADQIAAGARFEINKFGAARCPSLAEKSGVVIRCSPSNSGVTVSSTAPKHQLACIGIISLQHPVAPRRRLAVSKRRILSTTPCGTVCAVSLVTVLRSCVVSWSLRFDWSITVSSDRVRSRCRTPSGI